MRRLLFVFCCFAELLVAGPRAQETALDEYVYKPDGAYAWRNVRSIPGKGYTLEVVELTSQVWAPPEPAKPGTWRHWLLVYRPDEVEQGAGLLFISGGANGAQPPEKADDGLARIAVNTHSLVAELKMVPNQPLIFENDDFGGRKEDEIISYNWHKYLESKNPIWLTRLPMTKAAVKAMDALGEITDGKVGRFFVMGASKRGWTTWTTAAVDDRVIGIAPIVIDMLNLVPSFVHHYRVYGFWAPAVKDYFREGIMDAFQSPEFVDLLKIVEPYSYRERLTMPKFIVSSAGDQFFLPDSSQFYFDDLPGEKYLRYVPNSDHSLRDTDALESLATFYQALIEDRPRPRFAWKADADGALRVTAETEPQAVKLWLAHNPEHRDFRLESVGPIWQAVDLAAGADGAYVVRVEKPKKGFTAYFVELTFPSGSKTPFKFTTPVHVTPDEYPFGPPEAGKTRLGPQKQ
ncbi:MAG: PhoPQ-activated pathogenicity-related family protein [Bryobacterales bacterium]